jgi:hypothetical protein
LGHGASQGVPSRVDVVENRLEAGRLLRGGSRGLRLGQKTRNANRSEEEKS